MGAALILSAVGLYLSFEHVAAYGYERLRFQSLDKARLFTVGVDVGILILIAVDLLLEWLGRPIAWVRFPGWLLTGATVVLNAASAAPEGGAAWTVTDYVAVGAHGLVPVLFIVIVEIGKTAIGRVVSPPSEEEGTGIPVERWFLSPAATSRLWRRMKLWQVATYQEAIGIEQDRAVYRVMLERKYGSVRQAPADLRLPLTMAKYGLTVAQALALPQQQKDQEAALSEAEKDSQAAAATRAAERTAQAEITRLRTTSAVEAARHEANAATERAAVTSRAELVAAERAAEAEAQVAVTAKAAALEAARAEDARRAAEAREAAAVIEERAAGIEEAAAVKRLRAAEAEEETQRSEDRAARKARDAAEALKAAAVMTEAAAVIRERAAGIELRAVEAEDAARLSQRERTVRRVARMALAEAAGDVTALPLERIAEAFGVSSTTASEYRREAADLLAGGYGADLS
ncbi:DUF2637 domain-containing protein [Streptomyces sp. NPDC059708]|uniref:DUF2637 domain-containing protein n=1 Tax=Streptomyces sp. NPDC059708 TaxID=3346916 RepID=UPI003693D979